MIQQQRSRSRATAQTFTVLVCTLLVLAAVPAFGQVGEELDAGLQKLADASSGWADVSLNKATDTARFVRIPADISKSMVAGATVEDKAASFLEQHGRVFGVKDAARELVLFDVATKGVFTSTSYQQLYRNVPVFGGGIRVHFNGAGDMVAANGVFVPGISLSTTPRWSSTEAADVAIRAVGGAASGLGKALNMRDDLFAADAKLFVFRAGLVQGVSGSNHLVWEVEVVNKVRTVREFVYVDAHFGKVVDQITGIHEALDRDVSETSLGNVVWTEGDPDPIPGGWSGGSAQQIVDWQDEIDGARETYNFFGSMTNGGYLSYDGAMAQMRTVNNDPGISCPNANWNGISANYCTNVSADDVVAHEWGHAYTEYTNNLIYQWQSGALNESYSDMWGETIDQLNGRGTDAPANPRSAGGCSNFNGGSPDNSYLWLMGEDASAFGTAIRDMWNPNCEGDPGKVSDTSQYECTTFDGGGVHINSGIPNHAYALLVDGGTFNGFTISSIGFTKAARIHWEAQNLLGPASNFVDHADALDTACAALIGATLYNLDTSSPTGVVSGQTITAGDCSEVADAAAAVELRTEPTFCNFQPLLDPNAPALCGGANTTDIHFQDWESGLGSWTVGTRAVANAGTFDNPGWSVVGSLPDNQPGSAAFVEDINAGDCATDTEAGVLFLQSPVISIPAGTTAQMAFDHWVATEAGWDGSNVKVSVNGGAYSAIGNSAFDFNAYNGTLIVSDPQFGSSDNPMAGESAFTGTDGGSVGGTWGQSQIDLSGIAGGGDDIQLRFELGQDGCGGIIGWYVDDVRVYACACGDGVCEGSPTEDCNSCGADCPSFGGGAVCGNDICETADGENCQTCAADCNGRTGGKPANRFCCGVGDGLSPDGCGSGSQCNSGGNTCTESPAGGSSSCCGDLICEGQEDSSNCPVDCGPAGFCGDGTCDAGEDECSCSADCGAPASSEAGLCTDGIDNDCGGGTDCGDSDCSSDPACQVQCIDPGLGQPCTGSTNCCSGVGNCTGGKPSNRVCQ